MQLYASYYFKKRVLISGVASHCSTFVGILHRKAQNISAVSVSLSPFLFFSFLVTGLSCDLAAL